MVNHGAINGNISTVSGVFEIQQGYHNGSGQVKINETEQSKIIPANIKSGVQILGVSGTFTSDATASASNILSPNTAFVNGEKIIGTMQDNGAINNKISTASDVYTIPEGYHNGEGTVSISSVEQAKIISENIRAGVQILGITGSFTSDANAITSQILDGQTAYVNGLKITGSMNNRAAVNGVISTKTGSFTIQQGYHNGEGEVKIDENEQAKIIPQNIKSGIEILGVMGTHETGAVSGQTKTVTPSTISQTLTPDSGYDYITEINVEPIPYVTESNSAGGTTVIIGRVGE